MRKITLEGRKLMQVRHGAGLGLIVLLMMTSFAYAQVPNTYQPKFPGDPAHSDSEANALGYMRTVIRAEKLYQKKNDKYAGSLNDLVHTGNFTRRMTSPDRGDYTVQFHSKKDGYELTMVPKQQDADHRSFWSNEDGVIRADETKTADESSPKLK